MGIDRIDIGESEKNYKVRLPLEIQGFRNDHCVNQRGVAMRISVALATFNGSRFLEEQLNSILEQDHQPDELVIVDDASYDSTPRILRRFVESAPFAVRLTIQETNRGSTAAFDRAIGLCSGDVIALCDQDDVWQRWKLARLADVFMSQPDIGLVFSDAERISKTGNRLPTRLWPIIGLTPRVQKAFHSGQAFNKLLRRNYVTGATVAFRADLRDTILPIPASWVHDAWIALIAAAKTKCLPIPEPLIKYRQHDSQQIGAARRTWIDRIRTALQSSPDTFANLSAQFGQLADRLQNSHALTCDLKQLMGKIKHIDARHSMRRPRAWRLPWVVDELLSGRYFRFSRGWLSVAQDLFFP